MNLDGSKLNPGIGVSSREAFRLEVDQPEDFSIEKPVCHIRGWYATSEGDSLEILHFRIAGNQIPHIAEDRRDVEEVMPDYTVKGFRIPFDLSFYVQYIVDQRL